MNFERGVSATALDVRPPAFHLSPPRDETWGRDVSDLAELAGFAPYPEQRLALDDLFAKRHGKAAAFEFAVICSRQNLKTGLFKQAALGWLFITDQRLIVWSAHEFRTAQEAFRDMTELVEGTDFLRKRVKQIHKGNGDEAIELVTGQRLIFKARTEGSGRGLSADKVVLDEAYALRPYHMGALLPTLSARPDPQVVYGSSAGLATSEVLRALRDRGRSPGPGRLAYLEWCDPDQNGCERPDCDHAYQRDGCALDDVNRWVRANPSIGRGSLSLEAIEAERRAMPPDEFARERLGWWDEPSGGALINFKLWVEGLDPDSKIKGRPIFAVDMPLDRSGATIGAAGYRADGRLHVEMIEKRRGTEWIVPALTNLAHHHDAPVVVDTYGPAATFIPELKAPGVRVKVIEAKTRDIVAASGQLYDAIISGTVRHGPQPELDDAVRGAGRRPLGDGWAFGRRHSSSDISPLVAVTLAAWGIAGNGPSVYEDRGVTTL